MATRRFPYFIATRVTDGEQRRVDAAARLRGVNRAQYVRLAVLAAAEADIRREVTTAADDGSRDGE